MQEAQTSQVALLGPVAQIVPHVAADSAVLVVRDVRKVKLWSEFLRLEAAASRSQGKEEQALDLEVRAEAVEQAAGMLKASERCGARSRFLSHPGFLGSDYSEWYSECVQK